MNEATTAPAPSCPPCANCGAPGPFDEGRCPVCEPTAEDLDALADLRAFEAPPMTVQAEGPYVVSVVEPWEKRGRMGVSRVVFKRAFETRHGEDGWWEYVCALVNRLGQAENLSLAQRTAFASAYDYARLQLPSEGGKVSLPDGTEIEVKQTTGYELWELAGRPGGAPWLHPDPYATDAQQDEFCVSAFNASQEKRS